MCGDNNSNSKSMDNRLQQGVPGMADVARAKEYWDGIDHQRRAERQAQQALTNGPGLLGQSIGGMLYGPGTDFTLAGFQPPSAAPREKNLLEQAIRLVEFLKPLEPQARHAVWDIAMAALNNIRRTEDEEARKKQLAEDRHRASLSDNVKRNRVMSLRGAEDAEPEDEEDD